MDVKFSQKIPSSDSYYWTGSVISIGGKEFVDNEAKNAHVQITQNDGNVALVPIVQREDPDMTAYENISQIILNEELEPPSGKKIKFVNSQHEVALQSQKSVSQETDSADEEGIPDDNLDVSLNPDDVSKILNDVEGQDNVAKVVCLNTSKEKAVLNDSTGLIKGNEGIEVPKHSSTPANKKRKRTRTVNLEDIKDLERKQADQEAATAIKEAADKIMSAAEMMVNCLQELKPEIESLSNRNYREIKMSSNAVKQLVCCFLNIQRH